MTICHREYDVVYTKEKDAGLRGLRPALHYMPCGTLRLVIVASRRLGLGIAGQGLGVRWLGLGLD